MFLNFKSHGRIRKTQDVDMTHGSITKHILTFALPLIAGSLFQQLYNMVDTWVVGNFVSNEAFSAVGTVGPIINMLIGLFMGLSSGAGVLISQFYGAHKEKEVSDTVHTAVLMTFILGALITVIGILLIPLLLQIINMPTVNEGGTSVAAEATTYLTVYFAGILGLLVYNIGSGILRAVGDSTRPFYYLVVCALMNTGLDLLFVLVFKWGVFGVALATVLSQAVSAVLVMINLLRTKTWVHLQPRKLMIHKVLLKKIFLVGIPAALQLSITSFSNIFVQSYINYFGTDLMSGWTTYSKVDMIVWLPMQSIALATTTFVGQNLGSNQPDRAKKGVTISVLWAVAATAFLTVPVLLFAPQIVMFFNSEPKVIEYGTLLLYLMSPFYVLCAVNQVYACALRGAGNSRAPMITMLVSYVAFRQVYLFIMSRVCNEIVPIALSFPAGWFLCALITVIYFYKTKLSSNRLMELTQ